MDTKDTVLIFNYFGQAIGYGIVAVTFALQSLMKWACDRLTGFRRVAVADLFLSFSFVGTVNVWRGVWQLLDFYFLPGKHLFTTKISEQIMRRKTE